MKLVCDRRSRALAASLIAWPAVAAALRCGSGGKWSKVEIVHFEVVGEIADKHVQIPPSTPTLRRRRRSRDAVVRLEPEKNVFVGTPTFQNYPGQASKPIRHGAQMPDRQTQRPLPSISTSSRSSKARPARPPNSSASAFTPTRWSPNLAFAPAVRTRARQPGVGLYRPARPSDVRHGQNDPGG